MIPSLLFNHSRRRIIEADAGYSPNSVSWGSTYCALCNCKTNEVNSLVNSHKVARSYLLANEIVRKKYDKRFFLKPDRNGSFNVGGVKYSKSQFQTSVIGSSFSFKIEDIINHCSVINAYAFYGGGVVYADKVSNLDYAYYGIYHKDTNPKGEVLQPGTLNHFHKVLPLFLTNETILTLFV